MSFPAVILAQAKKAGITFGSLERQGVTKYCVKTASTPQPMLAIEKQEAFLWKATWVLRNPFPLYRHHLKLPQMKLSLHGEMARATRRKKRLFCWILFCLFSFWSPNVQKLTAGSSVFQNTCPLERQFSFQTPDSYHPPAGKLLSIHFKFSPSRALCHHAKVVDQQLFPKLCTC